MTGFEPRQLERPLLLVLLQGVDREHLHADRLPFLGRQLAAAVSLPIARSTVALGRQLLDADPAAVLRSMGLQVEQRSLSLRPAWRSDAGVLAQLARRPTGPAPVSLLALRDPLVAAGTHGEAGTAFAAALQRTDLHVQSALQLLRAGDPPELWCVLLGRGRPVHTTVDFAAALRRRFARPVRLAVTPGQARVQCRDHCSMQRLAELLATPPFARLGSVAPAPLAGALQFLAADGVAFAEQPLRARAPRADDGRAVALLPTEPRTATTLDGHGLAARLCLRALALWREPGAAVPTAAAPASAPDLLPLLSPHGHDAGSDDHLARR